MMSNREVDKWLGNKFDEKDESYQGMFAHDVPLQRTLSLDGGIDIFKHLQTIGSAWSVSSDASSWTVDSEERLNFIQHYKSLEDIPASQIRVRSRRASSEVDYTTGKSLALTVLKESYKGVDAGGTQIKKLQRCYTVSGTFDSFKEAMRNYSGDNLSGSVSLSRAASGSKIVAETLSNPLRTLHRSLSLRNAADNFEVQNYSVQDDDDDDYLEIRVPSYRNISIETKGQDRDVDQPSTRQRRLGVFDPSFQGIKRESSLRREVMIKNVQCKSCENITMQSRISRSGSSSNSTGRIRNVILGRNTSSLSIKRTFSFGGPGVRDIVVPTIVVTDVDTPCDSGVAKNDKVIPTDTSNSVEISRICDCQICMDVGEVRRCFVRRMFSKMFVNIITCREYGRKLTYWDENNNLNENEMYKCIMNVLKLMFGLWLRHLDHT